MNDMLKWRDEILGGGVSPSDWQLFSKHLGYGTYHFKVVFCSTSLCIYLNFTL